MDFGFKTESAREEFLSFFGEKHLWFWKIVETVRKAKVMHDFNVTDVLVNKNAIFLGTLKNFFDVFNDFCEGEVVFDERLIRDFVNTYRQKAGIDIEKVGGSFDFALSCYGYGTFRINYSESVASPVLNVRVLDFKIPELEDLMCPPYYLDFLNDEVLREESFRVGGREVRSYKINGGGLILHAGETGSGKTTFIASELQYLADRISGLIVTYEKPVEYRFVGPYSLRVIQYDLNVHLREEDVYHHFLRNSPHAGFFYEVKNRDEFVKVVDLASRGHLVFSTVHASGVDEVFSLFGLFEEEVKQMFFSSLRAIVCHKLVFDGEGRVVPLYEVFVKSEKAGPVMNMFMKNEFLKLKTYLYKERGYEGFYSFADYARMIRERARRSAKMKGS